ncbi:RNA methyltransferase, TrmH family [Nitritalea halalkaliphila LW7]|uniref:RNA methyltransferase, TrmH family n=1 Tax=Nitritalea halalkaliphila LW7 TaxID=1189621 RepID=I5CAQ9_9BACT|nr:RNA methyltransferase [Nitritalea halalkaliphila]EIM78911.1 RNA methyltransferase, TrmH family [Nitritalea halalkaliphila LW7]
MLSKNTLKFIKSLHLKKFRKAEGLFFVEGVKNVEEMVQHGFNIRYLLYTDRYLEAHVHTLNRVPKGANLISVSERELQQASALQLNNYVLAVAEIPEPQGAPTLQVDQLVLALDGVRDPGNLGTLLRIADWYGIREIFVSADCAELYNPKVLQASMGSFTRVRVHEVDLPLWLSSLQVPIYGAFLEGASVHQYPWQQGGVLLMGSESHGISEACRPYVSQALTIPRFGGAESLNVGVATAILIDHFKRQQP